MSSSISCGSLPVATARSRDSRANLFILPSGLPIFFLVVGVWFSIYFTTMLGVGAYLRLATT